MGDADHILQACVNEIQLFADPLKSKKVKNRLELAVLPDFLGIEEREGLPPLASPAEQGAAKA